MLNKHYTALLTLAMLVTGGVTAKSIASSNKVQSYSYLEDKLTTLKVDNSVSDRNLAINSKYIVGYVDKTKETIIAQDSSPVSPGNEDSTAQNSFTKLWWLVPLVVIVPFLGFLLLKPSSKPEQVESPLLRRKTTEPAVTGVPQSEPSISDNLTDVEGIFSPNQQTVNNELAIDSSVSEDVEQEYGNAEVIDNISRETDIDSPVLDNSQEQVEEAEIYDAQRDELKDENNQLLDNSISAESLIEAEEVISELTSPSISELEPTDINLENTDNSSAEEIIFLEEIAQSQPDLVAETNEMNTEVASEQSEKITDQDLANISEWLNEKVDADNKDVSVMDDFWDDLSSLTADLDEDITSEDTNTSTDQELANISDWLNEKVEPNSDFSDNNVDSLLDLAGEIEKGYDRELLDRDLNLEKEQNYNIKTKEGISDSTSNILEELLNEDSSQEHQN